MINFQIPGRPVGKARPRVTRWGTHNTEQTVLYENLVLLSFRQKYNIRPLESPLSVVINCFFKVPKSTTKKRRAAMLDGSIKATIKPDVDNIAKIITDALNEHAYLDDSQIVHLVVAKHYTDEEEFVSVQIEEF